MEVEGGAIKSIEKRGWGEQTSWDKSTAISSFRFHTENYIKYKAVVLVEKVQQVDVRLLTASCQPL